MVKNPPANTGGMRDKGPIPGLGGSPGGGHGNPLLYSCLENPMDRGAWRAAVHGVAKSRNDLETLHTYLVAQSRLTFYESMDCNLPGPSVHGILQARIQEWVAISSFRRSSQPRDQTHVSSASLDQFGI